MCIQLHSISFMQWRNIDNGREKFDGEELENMITEKIVWMNKHSKK